MEKNSSIYEISEEELINIRVENILEYLNEIEIKKACLRESVIIKFPIINSVIEASVNTNERKDDFIIRKVYNNFVELFYYLADEAFKISIFYSILRIKIYSNTSTHTNYKIKILRDRIRKDTIRYGEKIGDVEGAKESIAFLGKISADEMVAGYE